MSSSDVAHVSRIALLLVSLIYAAAASQADAQDTRVRFQRIGSDDGLPSMTVYDILQDRQGFIWIATHNGICKYDGYECAVYKHDPFEPNSLSENYVRTLHEDRHGHLWIGTNGGGLNRFDPKTETFTRFVHDPDDTTSISSNDVGALYSAEDGTIWVAARGGSLDALDPGTGRFEHHQPLDPDVMILDLEGADGDLWMVSFDGLTRYNPGSREIATFAPSGTDPYMYRFEAADTSAFWIASVGNGVFRFDKSAQEFGIRPADPTRPYHFDLNYVQTIRRGADGTIWYGTRGGGLSRLDPQNDAYVSYRNDPRDPRSLSSNDVRTILIDRTGLVWVGTLGGGVNTINPKTAEFRHYRHDPEDPSSLSHDLIQALYEDRHKRVWIGTYGNGLNRMSADSRSFSRFTADVNPDSLQLDSIWDILEDESGALWLATTAGLQRFDRTTHHFSLYKPTAAVGDGNNMVTTLHRDIRGRLWAGTYSNGLALFDTLTGTFNRYMHDSANPSTISRNEIWAIAEDDEGILWIGTEGGGLNQFDPETGIFRRFVHDPSNRTSLSQNSIRAIHLDASGRLWVGSGSGLNLFDRESESFVHYSEEDGLPDNAVVSIEEDGAGNLWIGTLNGLCRFDPAIEAFTVYDAADGLLISEFTRGSSVVRRNGTMLFGGTNGFVSFHPDSMDTPVDSPPIRLTALRINNRPADLPQHISFTEEIMLKHDENFLTFQFSTLDFALARRHRYAYRMAGVDDGWVYAGRQHMASYTDLAPGSYTFRARGVGRDGNTSGQIAAVRVVIQPPWWETWWFRLSAIALLAGGIIGMYRFRIEHLMEIERTRNRIAGDLHDDIGSRMSSIALSIDLVRRCGDIPSEQRRRLATAATSARRLVDDLRDTVWSIDADMDALTHLIDRIEQTANQILQGIRHRVHVPANVPHRELAMETRRNTLMLVKEALHNAARHSGASMVEIDVGVYGDRFSVRITDDGIGFDEESVLAGHGRKTMRRRAEAIGADLVIDSTKGKGTTVALDVDLQAY